MKGCLEKDRHLLSASCLSLIDNLIGQGSLGTKLLIYGGDYSQRNLQQDLWLIINSLKFHQAHQLAHLWTCSQYEIRCLKLAVPPV